jgi:aspartyl/asparaginyl-tRNA synthetase
VGKLTNETVIDIYGDIVKTEKPINSVTQSDVEVRARRVFVVSLASNSLPFQLEDAAKPWTSHGGDQKAEAATEAKKEEKSGHITVGQDIRLDNRWIDIRVPAHHGIFKIQSRVSQYFRQYFIDKDFIEIHTPKLTPGVSEGGANVFKLKYFDTPACLAQSPQLYKQMAVSADLMNVFEIGPVFRAEDSNTHR